MLVTIEKVSTKTLIDERDRSPFVFYPQRQQEPNSNLNTHFKGLQFESNVKREVTKKKKMFTKIR